MKKVIIQCECGCGASLEDKDKNGRKRQFILGHQARINNPFTWPEVKEKIKEKSVEICKKLSEAGKGRIQSAETRCKISETLKGRIFSKETLYKMSKAKLGKLASKETRKKMSQVRRGKNHHFYGKKMSKEHCRKLSESHIGLSFSIKAQKKLSNFMKKFWADPNRKKIRGEEIKKGLDNPKSRERRQELGKQHWSQISKEERIKLMKPAILAAQKANPSSLELTMIKVFNALNICYETQKSFGSYIVDFYLPDYNLIIECDGNYWHNLPNKKEKDQQRDQNLPQQGYKVLRL